MLSPHNHWRRLVASALSTAVLLTSTAFITMTTQLASAKNMNGAPGQYKIANGLTATTTTDPYSTDYTAEYFEVYSATIKTLYSEVFWAGMPPVPLPPHIVERFQNSTMAVVGYEVDQVQITTTTNPDGTTTTTETPLPITHAYNHHYCSWLVNSKKVRLQKQKAPEEMVRAGLTHGSDEHWVTELIDDKEGDPSNTGDNDPMVQFFSEGNGGEMRLSYHGYPQGYAQLIRSPDVFRLAPMMIDTFNRDGPGPAFRAGPMPASSKIPPSAGYSGLLECPCSDRIDREWNMTYTLHDAATGGACDKPVATQQECFVSASEVLQASVFRHHAAIHNNASMAPGCSLVQHQDGTTDVYWNPIHGNRDNNRYTNQESSLLAMDQDEHAGVDMSSSLSKKDKVAFAAGQVNITVAVQLGADDADDAVVIMIVGPPGVWFGVGFGSSSMCIHMQSDQCPDGGPYTIVVQGDHVEERQLGYHGPGVVLSNSTSNSSSHLKVHRNEMVGGNRTVVLSRSRRGASYSFNDLTSIPIITARGCGMEFAQHCGHGPGALNFVAMGRPTQICQAGIEGTIQGRKFWQEGRCASSPKGSLITKEHVNPTCKIETYRGGLYCCNHGQYLLDRHQEIPWANQYLEYQLKFRFYFEGYNQPSQPQTDLPKTLNRDISQHPSHQNLVRLFWAMEGNAGEYDILQCHNNTAPSQCVQVISSRFQVKDMLHDCGTHTDASWCSGKGSTDPNKTEGIQLIYVGPHCHAPACLSMELYHANTGQLLCRTEPIYGQSKDQVYDEHGYLAIPPCLWGDPSEGLPSPILLPLDAELLAIKRNNNTLPHTGEMALWQMRGVVVPKEGQQDDDINDTSTTSQEHFETASTRRRRRREGV